MKRVILLVLVVALLAWAAANESPAGTISGLSFLAPGTEATVDQAIIISTTDLVADAGMKCFQIRDNTGAVTIYGSNAHIDAALSGFSVGSIIEISGLTGRHDGMLTLDGIPDEGTVGGFAVSGRTSTLPLFTGAIAASPSDLADWSLVADSLESNLICLQNVWFDSDGAFVAGLDYALAGGPAVVRIVTADLGLAGMAIPDGPLNITGILLQCDPSNPVTSGINYRLAPRRPGDIVSVPEPLTLAMLALGGVMVRRSRKL